LLLLVVVVVVGAGGDVRVHWRFCFLIKGFGMRVGLAGRFCDVMMGVGALVVEERSSGLVLFYQRGLIGQDE
jgi:hypothetical protein